MPLTPGSGSVKPHRWLAWLALAVLLLARRAEADASDADRASARALAVEGFHALDAKDFVTAADRFTRADALVHAPTLLLGLARADAGLGKLVAAQEAYHRLVREPVAAGAPQVFLDAVESGKTELAALEPRLAWVTVNITGAGAADVKIDGVTLPSAAVGAPRPVDPGQHVVTATAPLAKAVANVTLIEGQRQTISLVLDPVAPPPGAPVAAPISLGKSAPSAAAPAGSLQRTLGFASLGVGAAGVVLGVATGAAAGGIHGSLVGSCVNGHCPASDQAKLDSYNTMGLVSTVGFVAGGALAGLGVVLLITAPKAPAAQVGVMVAPAAGGGVLGAVGRF